PPHRPHEPGAAADLPAELPGRVPGCLQLTEPPPTGEGHRRPAVARVPGSVRARVDGADGGSPRERRARTPTPVPLSAPVLGGPAPAHLDRPGPGPRS